MGDDRDLVAAAEVGQAPCPSREGHLATHARVNLIEDQRERPTEVLPAPARA